MPIQPDKNAAFPNAALKNMCYIKNTVKAKNVLIGDYTYYDDPGDGSGFERDAVLFNNPEFGDKLIIGKFCSIATGAQFLMGSANHRMSSVSAYPFAVFGGSFEQNAPPHLDQLPFKGDIVIGNDVWIGRDAFIMPGVQVGDGAFIGAKSVVAKDVPPYAIVGGNPARVLRKRFDDAMIARLLALKWWDWSDEKIAASVAALCSDDVEALFALA